MKQSDTARLSDAQEASQLFDVVWEWFSLWVELQLIAFQAAFYPMLRLTGLEAEACPYSPVRKRRTVD